MHKISILKMIMQSDSFEAYRLNLASRQREKKVSI